MRHPWARNYPAPIQHSSRRSPSIAGAMRARGFARALGALPSAFDMHATVLAPATRRLGGMRGLGSFERVVENWDPSWGLPTQGGTMPVPTSPMQSLPGDPITSSPTPTVVAATEESYAAPSLEQQRVSMVTSQAATIPGIVEGQAQAAPYVSTSIAPPGTSPSIVQGPTDYIIPSGLPSAQRTVDAAHAGSSPAVPPGDPLAPVPDVRINGPIPYGDDTITAGPITNGAAGYRLPFGWPWWVWAAIAAGAATGVYALTRR